MTKPKLSIKAELVFLLFLSILSIVLIHSLKSAASGSWVTRDQQVYYEDRRGNLVTGWQIIDGKQYYFDASGVMVTGWMDLDGGRFYFGPDGVMATLWQQIDGKQYYFSPGGKAVTGWQGIDGKRFFFLADHTLASGLTVINGQTYCFREDGQPFSGVTEVDGRKCLFLSSGAMATGWTELDGRQYFAAEDGTLHIGWLTQGEYRYYFHPDGSMAVGKTEIDGQTLYFTPKGIHVTLVNPWHSVPAGYTVDLIAISEDYAVDKACCDALTRMLIDCELAGLEPLICSAYRTQADQEWLYARKVNYYLKEGLEEAEAKKQAGRSVAVPGTSEHQLGLAVDIVSTDYYVLDESQATTKTQKWLMEHCWEYGFILRYPVDKSHITGIIFEPWHYRYVGVEVALDLRDSGLCLEEYLGAVSYG